MKGCIARKKIAGKTHYYVVVDLPRHKGEKRKQKWVPAGTSYRHAEFIQPQVLLDVQRQGYMKGQSVTFKQIADDYLFHNKQRLASSTYKRYEGITKVLKEYFGAYTLNEIEPYLVDQFTKTLIQRQLSVNSISKYRVVLKQIFEYAKDLKLIQDIPLAKFRHGRSDAYSFQVWDSQEVNDFLLHIKDAPLYMPVYLAVHTGMRLGEVLALKWSAIDFKNQQLTVRYSLDVNGQLKTTKTKQSRRTIKLTPTLLATLKEHQHTQKVNKLLYGNAYHKNDFVCTFADGKPISRNYISTTFRRKVKQLKFPVIRFHDLRHTFATIALSHNVHTKVVQEILGHASSRTTLDVYSHVIPSMQEQSVDILEKAFQN